MALYETKENNKRNDPLFNLIGMSVLFISSYVTMNIARISLGGD
jgi:hypothetical protein